MNTTIRARFANGVLEPFEDLGLNEGEEVVLRVEPLASARRSAWLEDTARSWKSLVDVNELKRRIEESRLMVTRSEPRF